MIRFKKRLDAAIFLHSRGIVEDEKHNKLHDEQYARQAVGQFARRLAGNNCHPYYFFE